LPFRLAGALLRPRARLALAWLTTLFSAALALFYAWDWATHSARRDGNNGHVIIDFGGQWIMARMIVEGHGQRLYDRTRLRPVLEAAYPLADGAPNTSDAEDLLGSVMGEDDPRASAVAGSFVAPLAARSPLEASAALAAGRAAWTEEALTRVQAPQRGGALYPPVHALLYAPLACLPPRPAYRTLQVLNMALMFLGGWVIARLSHGRVWWPVATFALMLFPGFAGSLNLAQNASVSLAILLLGWWQIAGGRPALGGACWGLLAYKPVWAVAFFPVLLLSRRWRAAASMLLTGAGLVALTLPLVGLHSWLDWRQIGREAVEGYARYENWVFLSRDLTGIPRRWLFDFKLDDRGPHAELATWLGRGLVLAVAGGCLLVALLRPRRVTAPEGPPAAFLLLGGWLTCLHFMYYDTLLAALPVCLLFTDPARCLDVRFWRPPPGPVPAEVLAYYRQVPHFDYWMGNPGPVPAEVLAYYRPPLSAAALAPPLLGGWRPRWVFNHVPLTLLVLICGLTQLGPILDPLWHFAPYDTFGLLLLWGWCGWRTLRDERGPANRV
jgi:hypothetical protein